MNYLYDPISMTMGWLVGRRIAGQRGKRTPIAYLYNGVRLPKLPEWDSKYRNVTITAYTQGTYLAAYTSALSISGSKLVATESGKLLLCLLSNNSWVLAQEGNIESGYTEVVLPFWANIDLLNEDGTLYLAASDPVPVYES